MAIIANLIKRFKKMKTLITVPNNSFQTYNAVLNNADELEIVGTDGNGVAFQQTLAIQPNSVVFFNVSSRNFVSVPLQSEVTPDYQMVNIVRDIA